MVYELCTLLCQINHQMDAPRKTLSSPWKLSNFYWKTRAFSTVISRSWKVESFQEISIQKDELAAAGLKISGNIDQRYVIVRFTEPFCLVAIQYSIIIWSKYFSQSTLGLQSKNYHTNDFEILKYNYNLSENIKQ